MPRRGRGGAAAASADVSKRPPPRETPQKHDIYVNNNSQFLAQLSKAQKALDEGLDHVTIHGLGAAIPLAINLAMELQRRFDDSLVVSPATSTVELVDDVLLPDGTVTATTRNNSAMHITVRRR
eukprot:m.67104 g.67104  ORF g.67104 m.67104 type:complete len:124 (+) comp12688_c1_seq1:1857-2228(+)